MPSPAWWKNFYAGEREHFGRKQLERFILEAPCFENPDAIVFPHTRLTASGLLIAGAAKSIVESRANGVVAIGVLHGQARNAALRRIYTESDPITFDEFSLDNFDALITIAAEIAGQPKPVIYKRYPFLTGENPESIPGFDEVASLIANGYGLVATADLIHHGIGYNSDELRRESPETVEWARNTIATNFEALSRHDYDLFQTQSITMRSDFRDSGPVLAELLESFETNIRDLSLVDYSDVLEVAQPTWVAAGLIEARRKFVL